MKRSMILSTLLVANVGFAKEHPNADLVNNLAQFVEKNITGHTFKLAKSGELNNGQLSYDFERASYFTQFERSKAGVRYTAVYSIKQSNYRAIDGRRQGEPDVKDRILTQKCELKVLESAPVIVGFCRIESSTQTDVIGYGASLITAKLVGNQMTIKEIDQPGDHFGAEDSYILASSDIVNTITANKDGTTTMASETVSYRLDPDTLERDEEPLSQYKNEETSIPE